MADEREERIYQLCTWLRISEEPVEENKPCKRCPARIDTNCGPGMRGCYALAEEAYRIAHGELLGRPEPQESNVIDFPPERITQIPVNSPHDCDDPDPNKPPPFKDQKCRCSQAKPGAEQ